jgi:hypothetical protein
MGWEGPAYRDGKGMPGPMGRDDAVCLLLGVWAGLGWPGAWYSQGIIVIQYLVWFTVEGET